VNTEIQQRNFFESIKYLWDRRFFIMVTAASFILGGAIYCLVAPRQYMAQVILFPKESGAGSARGLLASAGGLALNPFQNAALSRMEIFLGSEELAERVVRADSLLPILFRGEWDQKAGRWKDPKAAPDSRDGARALLSRVRISPDARNLYLELSVTASDPEHTVRILEGYLRELNQKIRNDAVADAQNNQRFLEQRLAETGDPMIQERIRQLMGAQIENLMYMSASSFDIPERPKAPRKPEKPKKGLIMAVSVFLGFAFPTLGLLLARRLRRMALTVG
jgi:uncharacterized protein involved in exopolysaccharide biosynthesis